MSNQEKSIQYYPLTHAQKRVWYMEKTHLNTSEANLSFTIRYKGDVNFMLLSKAINLAIKTNDALRLRMTEIEQESVIETKQYLTEYRGYTLDYFDFSGKGGEKKLREWLPVKSEELFQFTDSDLFYFALLRYEDDETGYYLKTHHIVSDGWTLFLLVNEIDAFYKKLLKGEKPDESLRPSYLDYVKDEAEYENSERFKEIRCSLYLKRSIFPLLKLMK
ncbi:MAG: hypothetical protein K8S00_01465 [Bacteroidales bacterium]|nr:hypothetical protein [Bacteroidales bacterium]